MRIETVWIQSETVSQEQLDILLYTEKMTETIKTDLPKGLNEFTLNEITTYIQSQNEPRSAEEVALELVSLG